MTDGGNHARINYNDTTGSYKPVENAAYQRIKSMGIFGDNRDNLIAEAMKDVIRKVDRKEPGTEFLSLYRYRTIDFIDGVLSEIGAAYISIHNHANGETFSIGDIYNLTSYDCKAIFVVGDNRNCYALYKTDDYDGIGFLEKVMARQLGFEPYTFPTEIEFIKECEKYGIKYAKRTD